MEFVNLGRLVFRTFGSEVVGFMRGKTLVKLGKIGYFHFGRLANLCWYFSLQVYRL